MRIGYKSVCCFFIAIFGAITFYYGGLDRLTASIITTLAIFNTFYLLEKGKVK